MTAEAESLYPALPAGYGDRMTQQGGSWLDRFEKFGDKVAGQVAEVGRQAKADIDQRSAVHAQQQAQAIADRQANELRRWERSQSPTWTTPPESVDTVEWATYELRDPRSGLDAVKLRHPADWGAGGSVTWPPEPGVAPRYAIGASPQDQSCVAERFARLDFVTGPLAGDGGGRLSVPPCSGEELVGRQVVPRLRGARPNLLVVQVQRVDPALYSGQRINPQLAPEGYLAWVEYDRDGVPWADEMLVLRYSLGDQRTVQTLLHGCSVWSLNAAREAFPTYRGILRAIALSASTHPGWDSYIAETARAVVVP